MSLCPAASRNNEHQVKKRTQAWALSLTLKVRTIFEFNSQTRFTFYIR